MNPRSQFNVASPLVAIAGVVAVAVGMTGACGSGTATSVGTGGRGGAAGGAGGRGGGAGGTGGQGGIDACAAITALDRSCATVADCVAVSHETDCCGNHAAIGIRDSQVGQYNALEPPCAASLPGCPCAISITVQGLTTDDGAVIPSLDQAGLLCTAGHCTTFSRACGDQPCATGKTCFTCPNGPTRYAVCSVACTSSTGCTDPALSSCQTSQIAVGNFCASSTVACGTP